MSIASHWTHQITGRQFELRQVIYSATSLQQHLPGFSTPHAHSNQYHALMEFKEIFQRLLSYARPQWKLFLLALFSFIGGAAVEPIVPALFKKLIDSGFKEGLSYPLWLVPVVVIGLFIVRGVLNFAGTYAMTSATSMVVLQLRLDLMRALLRADARLFTKINPGNAVTKIVNEPQSIAQLLGGSLISVIKDSMTLLFLLGYLSYLNWQLTLLSFVSIPLLGVTLKAVQQRLRKIGQTQYESQQRLINAVDDNARAWRIVRTFDARDFELQRFDREAERHRRATMKQVATSSLVTPTSQVIAAIGVSTIVTLAIYQVSQGASTVGDFVSFITALLMTITPMRHLTDIYQPFNSAFITARGAFTLINTPPEPDDGKVVLNDAKGDIRFDQVTLKYQGASTPSLSGFDLHIGAGETIALVGASGAGKTSVINALLRFATPSQGRILLDGIPVSDLTLKSLRKHFAVVSQDIVLFDGSVAQNVAYASPHMIDEGKVVNCLRAANLWDHISSMPDGIHSRIGTNGSMLSGGQRQRLAIARALYRNATIWIFDEATSALDSKSELLIQKSIESLRANKTLILIAHRLSTIRHADSICVMSEGRIIEKGSHPELLQLNGVYSNMVRIQATR